MNAIDQYVAPAPPRPNPQPASTPRAASDSSGSPTFGDVYNKAANTNQSDKDPVDTGEAANAAQQPKSDDAQQPKADAKGTAKGEKETAQGNNKPVATAAAGAALLALTAEVNGKQASKNGDQSLAVKSDQEPETPAPTSNGNLKVGVDIEKLLDKAAANKATVQTEVPATATAPETDAAALALKLLGAETVAKGADKKLQPEEPGKKDDPAKDKNAADAKADTAGPVADATNALAAAALAVHAAGGQAKDQPEQGKSKSDELSAKSLTATATQATAPTDDATKTSDSGETIKPETVTVLDARRFVGSGETMSPNTQAVLSGVTGDSDWSAAMKAASAAANAPSEPRTATPVNTLKIQMTPESIGNVTATLRLHGDQLTVHLQVESGEAFKQLSQDKEGLIQSLKSQGFSVDQVSVQLAPAPTTDRTVAQTSTGQQAGGQMQDGSSAGQFAQQGREQDNNRRQQDNGFNANWQGDDKSMAGDPVAPASDAARSGQVYL